MKILKIYGSKTNKSDREAEYQAYLDKFDKFSTERDAYEKAERAASNAIQDELNAELGELSKYVTVYVSGYDNGQGFDIELSYKSPTDSDVRWDFKAYVGTKGDVNYLYTFGRDYEARHLIDTGNPNNYMPFLGGFIKSNDDLQRSIDLLEFIDSVDWDDAVHQPSPKYSDFVKTKAYDPTPRFEAEDRAEELSEYVNKNVLLYGNVSGYKYTGNRHGVEYGWYKLISETPKTFIAKFIYKEDMDTVSGPEDIKELLDESSKHVISKAFANSFIQFPIKTISY